MFSSVSYRSRISGWFLRQLHKGFAAESTHAHTAPVSAGQAALDRVAALYEKQEYITALRLITAIERQYPECSKAAKMYRGKVGMAYLEQEDRLAGKTMDKTVPRP